MKKLSITFGNGIYFDCFTSGKAAVQVGTFVNAWWSTSAKDVETCMGEIKVLLPEAQLSIVSHEPKPYTP